MNWEAISAIGQLIGAIGVIATIGYLALQIRQNTRAVRGASEFDAMNLYTTVNDYLLQSPELLEFVVRAQAPGVSLSDFTPNERTRIGIFGRILFLRFHAHFHLYRNGLVDKEGWENWRAWARGFLEAPAFAEWWQGERTQTLYTQAFCDDIESAPITAVNIAGIDRFDSGDRPIE